MFGKKKRKILNLTKEIFDLNAKLNKRDLAYSDLEMKLSSKDSYIKELESKNNLLNSQMAELNMNLCLSIGLNDKLGVDIQNKIQQLIDLEINSNLVKDSFNSNYESISNKNTSLLGDKYFLDDDSVDFIPYDTKTNPNNYNRTKLYRLRNGELKLSDDGELYSLYAVNFLIEDAFCRVYLYATKENVNKRFVDLLYSFFAESGFVGVAQGKVDATFQIRLSDYKESFKSKNIDKIFDFTGLNS